jgi:hypothetical protein
MSTEFKFYRYSKFFWWLGRYGRLIGGSAWKVALRDEILVEWQINSDTKAVLRAKKTAETKKLAEAINEAKRIMGSEGGGIFSINEYGQVIVPSVDGDGRRILVGKIEGPILLQNPYSESKNDKWIDISDDSGLKCGDRWPFPYLGVVYRLSQNNQIYYKEDKEDESRLIYAPVTDEQLVKKLRSIRPYGPVRFLVNPYGIVLTKKAPLHRLEGYEEGNWEPTYVGRINYNKWFPKEE